MVPFVSIAVAVMLIELDTLLPRGGEEMETTMEPLAAFATVTGTGAEIDWLPALSETSAVRTCNPFAAFVVSHAIEYGALVAGIPRFVPSSLNWTPVIVPLVSDALAVTLTVAETLLDGTGDTIATFREPLPPFETLT